MCSMAVLRKIALRTLDFSKVKPTIAMLRERRARALKMLGRDSLGETAKLGPHALRSRILDTAW